jgi:hypothetical protein
MFAGFSCGRVRLRRRARRAARHRVRIARPPVGRHCRTGVHDQPDRGWSARLVAEAWCLLATVHDLSNRHNFHIFGPAGLDEVVTTVPFTGDVTVKILLKHGTVVFQCDPHQTMMNGSFMVGGAGQSDEQGLSSS